MAHANIPLADVNRFSSTGRFLWFAPIEVTLPPVPVSTARGGGRSAAWGAPTHLAARTHPQNLGRRRSRPFEARERNPPILTMMTTAIWSRAQRVRGAERFSVTGGMRGRRDYPMSDLLPARQNTERPQAATSSVQPDDPLPAAFLVLARLFPEAEWARGIRRPPLCCGLAAGPDTT